MGNTIKTVGTYWIVDSIQWQGYWVPPVTVRGLDQRTEEYAHSPATQGRNHPLLDSPEQDNPAVGAQFQLPTKPNKKGPLNRGKSRPTWA